MPKVSVIIPVYGVEKYIEKCARSLFGQTIDDIEYLFIDDCTPDRSIEILKRVLEVYPQRKEQVIIHRMEQNSGQAAVRKWGMQNATGEYVIHCDSDDWVDTNMYLELYTKAKSTDADIVVCDFCMTDGRSYQKRERGLKNIDTFLSDMMYSKISWSLGNKLVSHALYDNSFEYPTKNVGEDMATILQLSKNAAKVEYCPNLYYYYYSNPNSIMNSSSDEKVYSKYLQMCNNVDIVCNAYENSVLPFNVKYRLDSIKLYCKDLLLPALNINNKTEWENKYRDIGLLTFINPNVRFRYRLIYILNQLHLYKFLKSFK